MQLECAQCLEMYKERKMKVVMDAFERAFFCSKECFVEHWTEHRMRHGPAYSRATKENGEVHRFEAHDEGCAERCGFVEEDVFPRVRAEYEMGQRRYEEERGERR